MVSWLKIQFKKSQKEQKELRIVKTRRKIISDKFKNISVITLNSKQLKQTNKQNII